MSSTLPDDDAEPLEPRYLVSVTMEVDGLDPSEAAKAFGQHVTTYGLASLTYNVIDRDLDEAFLATYDNFVTVDEVLDLMDDDDDDDDEDEDEDDYEDDDGEPRMVITDVAMPPFIGTCARCKEADVELLDGGLCAACTVDIQGAPA